MPIDQMPLKCGCCDEPPKDRVLFLDCEMEIFVCRECDRLLRQAETYLKRASIIGCARIEH